MSVLQALSTTLDSVRTQSGPHLTYAPRSYSAYPPSSTDFFGTETPPESLSASESPAVEVPPVLLGLNSSPTQVTPLSSGLHPMLYQVLDKVITLEQCEVYSYAPEMESDPHADDTDSDSASDVSSPSEDESYDLLGLDDGGASSPPKAGIALSKSPYGSWVDDDDLFGSPEHARATLRKTTGGLLWSSHHFFYNRKLKRILFVTIWAKKRRRWTADSEDEESFSGWNGGVGAGARALGLGRRFEDDKQ